MHYNRDHLKEGYQPDQAPSTWGQAGEALKKLTKTEGGRITRLGGARAGGVGGFILYTLNNKGKYLTEDGRKVQFDSPETVEALEWMQSFWEPAGRAAITAFNQAYPTTAAQSPFTTGNQTFTVTNPSQIFHIRANNPGLDFGVALRRPGPRIPGGRASSAGLELRHPRRGQAPLRGPGSWCAGSRPPKKAAGWFMQQQLRPSPMKEVNEDRSYVEKLPTCGPSCSRRWRRTSPCPSRRWTVRSTAFSTS